MAIHVIGFRWGDSDENHKYDYESLANIPSTDLGVLDIDTTAEQGTDDGDLYRAIHSFSWDSVINTLSGILNVKKLFTNIINQVKTNKDKLDDPGQILKDGIGSLSTSSSVINSDRFIIKENDGSIKQVTPLNTLKGGVRNLSTVVSYINRYIPIISASDSSDISKTTVANAVQAGIYNLSTGTASGLSSDKSDKIVVQTTPPSGSLDPASVEKHTLSEIYDLFNIVDKTTPLLNFDDTAVDPTTDDGALANALTSLGILSDVIPSGGGMLYLKKVLTELSNKFTTISEETLTFSYGGKSVNILFRVSGNVLSVAMSKGDESMTLPTGWLTVGTLSSIRPSSNWFLPMVSSNGLTFTIRVWPDGGVSIIAHSSNPYWLQTSATVIYK